MAGTLKKLGNAPHTCLKMPPHAPLGLMPCTMVATSFLIVFSSFRHLVLLNLTISSRRRPSSFRVAGFNVMLTKVAGKQFTICPCTACTNTASPCCPSHSSSSRKVRSSAMINPLLLFIMAFVFEMAFTLLASFRISSAQTLTTVGFHNFNLRIFNLRISNPNKLRNCGCLFDTMSDFNVPGSRPKKHYGNSEIDRTYLHLSDGGLRNLAISSLAKLVL